MVGCNTHPFSSVFLVWQSLSPMYLAQQTLWILHLCEWRACRLMCVCVSIIIKSFMSKHEHTHTVMIASTLTPSERCNIHILSAHTSTQPVIKGLFRRHLSLKRKKKKKKMPANDKLFLKTQTLKLTEHARRTAITSHKTIHSKHSWWLATKRCLNNTGGIKKNHKLWILSLMAELLQIQPFWCPLIFTVQDVLLCFAKILITNFHAPLSQCQQPSFRADGLEQQKHLWFL